jgi:hypothetical protein
MMAVVRGVVFLAAVLVMGPARFAFAQSGVPGSDVAFQASMLRLTEDSVEGTSWSFGGRVTARVFRWISLDGELTYAPTDDLEQSFGTSDAGGLTYHRSRLDGLLGVKVGPRFDRVGVFAKVRPGFSNLTGEGVGCDGDVCALILIAPPEYGTEFIMDLGGVVEFYPSDRLLARVDVGTTFIRHRSFAPPCSDCTSTNLNAGVGFGVRF